MADEFAPQRAKREGVHLIIGLSGGTGSGKTMSAFRLAQGIVGEGKQFGVVDTENKRALHYADQFSFDHVELRPPYRPARYRKAIEALIKIGHKVIVVDSTTHEWNGEGGVLDWREEIIDGMVERAKKRPNEKRQEWQIREAMNFPSWIEPKMAHKAFVQWLLQVPAHIIFCFRAEEKVKIEKGDDGKQKVVPLGWQPVTAKDFPYELTCYFLLTNDKPGIPQPLKLQRQHMSIFPQGVPIDEAAGKRLAEWAAGGAKIELVLPPPEIEVRDEAEAKAEAWWIQASGLLGEPDVDFKKWEADHAKWLPRLDAYPRLAKERDAVLAPYREMTT